MKRCESEHAFVLLDRLIVIPVARPFGGAFHELSHLGLTFLRQIGATDDEAFRFQDGGGVRRQERVKGSNPLGIQTRSRVARGIKKAWRGIKVGEWDAKLHEPRMNSLFPRSVQPGDQVGPNPTFATTWAEAV